MYFFLPKFVGPHAELFIKIYNLHHKNSNFLQQKCIYIWYTMIVEKFSSIIYIISSLFWKNASVFEEMYDVLLPEAIIAESPSKRDGVAAHDELLHRCFGSELIQEANILLRLPQVAAVTAQNIFHRLFYRKSLKRFDVFTVSMGCALLSSKIEETPKLLREVRHVFSPRNTIIETVNGIRNRLYMFSIICTR